eukprot:674593-Pyramimonas_sp.AAC.2
MPVPKKPKGEEGLLTTSTCTTRSWSKSISELFRLAITDVSGNALSLSVRPHSRISDSVVWWA